ncbi:MAG: hypothetical protein RLZZ459_8, partial [Cyanobacteriota bacterium]
MGPELQRAGAEVTPWWRNRRLIPWLVQGAT